MNEDSRRLLELDLDVLHSSALALIGDPAEAHLLIESVLTKLNRTFSFVATESMPSTEQILVQRRTAAQVNSGYLEVPTFMQTFLQIVGVDEVPEVLILERFNSKSGRDLYYVKTFLDMSSREVDPIYERLKCIILTLQSPGSEGTFPVDPSIRSCIQEVIVIDGETPKTG